MNTWIAVLSPYRPITEEDRALICAVLVYTAPSEEVAREMAEGTVRDLRVSAWVEVESVKPLITKENDTGYRTECLHYLETRVLAGKSSPEEVSEYNRLAAINEAWVRTTPEFKDMSGNE